MKTCLHLQRTASLWRRQTLCRTPQNARFMSRSLEDYVEALTKKSDKPNAPLTFENTGLRPQLVKAIRAAFPNIKEPTESQARFIPAILEDKDVLLKDETGSGKSFGIVLALLNRPRLRFRDPVTGELRENPSITSLLLVPHRDLAYQIFHWIQKIATAHDANHTGSITGIAQVLVRDGGQHLKDGLSLLRKESPHILIATPQAVMDIWKEDADALPLLELSSVVVDEVDYLIETFPKRKASARPNKKAEKALRKIEKHPGVTRELLDIIYERRRRLSGSDDLVNESYHTPQLILSSATLSMHLKQYLSSESDWLNEGNVVAVRGRRASIKAPSDGIGSERLSRQGGDQIHHSILIVSDDEIKNIATAVPETVSPVNTSTQDTKPTQAIVESVAAAEPETDIEPQLLEKYSSTPSPFNQNALDAIATAFALDVPSIALLVIPSSASVSRALYDLRSLGVNAHGLDLLAEDKGRAHLLRGDARTVSDIPTLLVCTPATTRGLDLPELTHVFILGIPDGASGGKRNGDTYTHLAGRVGRFGRGGRVITIVEKAADMEPEPGEGGEKGIRWESKDSSRMMNIMRRIGVVPVRFGHFD